MDEADIASLNQAQQDDLTLGLIRSIAKAIPAGKPGECGYCGEFNNRIVRGACSRCRDELRLA